MHQREASAADSSTVRGCVEAMADLVVRATTKEEATEEEVTERELLAESAQLAAKFHK